MRRRLVGHDIEPFPSPGPFGLDFRRVAHKGDRERLAVGRRPARECKCLIGRFGESVDIADLESPARSSRVDLDTDGGAAVHRDSQGLSATHTTKSSRQGHAAAQGPVEMLAGQLRERLVGALEDALRPDIDPRAGCHLAVHRQACPLEVPERVPVRPAAHEVGVGDEHARSPLVRAKNAHRLAALDQEALVVRQATELTHDRIERRPASRRPAGTAVDHEVKGSLRHVRIQVVHEHPERRFLRPAAARQIAAPRRPDWPRRAHSAHDSGTRRVHVKPGPSVATQALDHALAKPRRDAR